MEKLKKRNFATKLKFADLINWIFNLFENFRNVNTWETEQIPEFF